VSDLTAAAAIAALADPTRRVIIDRLRQAPESVGEIARGLPVSRPAVSQHLAVLRRHGLVSQRREGRRQVYRLDPSGLLALRQYVETLWQDVLAAYAQAAEQEAAQSVERVAAVESVAGGAGTVSAEGEL
jgi:DNA-binding transcriptional ArsR family regulator